MMGEFQWRARDSILRNLDDADPNATNPNATNTETELAR